MRDASEGQPEGASTPAPAREGGVETDGGEAGGGPEAPPRATSVALWGIFVILAFHALHSARTLFLPMALALLANFALRPVVRSVCKRGIPRTLAAGLAVLALFGGGAVAVAALATPAADWLERAPGTLREVARELRPIRDPVERIARATREVEEATTIEEKSGEEEVRVREKSLFSDLVLQTQGAIAGLAVMLVLLFFLLASDDGLVRVVAALPWWRGDAKQAGELVEAIEKDVSRHLFTISLINLGLGCLVGLSLKLLGMPNAALWGAMATVLNFVPFLGAMVGTVVVTFVAVITFDGLHQILAVPAVFALLTSIEGMLITPMLLGQRLTLSPVAVFTSILVGSWMWGVPGALVAVPLLAVAKIVSDRIEALHPLAVLIGR